MLTAIIILSCLVTIQFLAILHYVKKYQDEYQAYEKLFIDYTGISSASEDLLNALYCMKLALGFAIFTGIILCLFHLAPTNFQSRKVDKS